MITGETIWESNIHPDKIHRHRVKHLNSKHLANILHFFRTTSQCVHGHDFVESLVIGNAMMEEARKRELTPEFLQGAPYPYDPTAPYEEYLPVSDTSEG